MPLTHYELVCPHSLRTAGNNFMGVAGSSLSDLSTFPANPRWRRIDNHSQTFHVVKFQDNFNFEDKIAEELVAPSYDTLEEYVDVSDAQITLDNAVHIPPYDSQNLPLAAPTTLIIGREVTDIEYIYGLELIPDD